MKFTFAIITILILSSCGNLKLVKSLHSGEIKQEAFTQEIPFVYRLGIIVLPVEIEGKTYNFLFDTGAPNVISPELSRILLAQNGIKHKTSDSQGEASQLEFVTVKSIKIGGIEFENTAAAIADLNQSNEVACLKIDGIIGANLMRLCQWKIDYDRQILTLSNEFKQLKSDTSFVKIPFDTELSGTPVISLKLDNHTIEKVKFDTGSTGFLDLPVSTLKNLEKSKKNYDKLTSFGINGSGLFGTGKEDTLYYVQIPEIEIAGISIPNKTIEFVHDHSLLLGTQFFKHFNVYLDWQAKEIYLEQQKGFENLPFQSFGFNAFYSNDQLIVKELFQNAQIRKMGLQIGDQILTINGKDYSVFTKEMWCEFIEEATLKNESKLELLVARGDVVYNFVLEKEMYFSK